MDHRRLTPTPMLFQLAHIVEQQRFLTHQPFGARVEAGGFLLLLALLLLRRLHRAAPWVERAFKWRITGGVSSISRLPHSGRGGPDSTPCRAMHWPIVQAALLSHTAIV